MFRDLHLDLSTIQANNVMLRAASMSLRPLRDLHCATGTVLLAPSTSYQAWTQC